MWLFLIVYFSENSPSPITLLGNLQDSEALSNVWKSVLGATENHWTFFRSKVADTFKANEQQALGSVEEETRGRQRKTRCT